MRVWHVRPVYSPMLLRSGAEKSVGSWVAYDNPEELARDNFYDLENGDLLEVRVGEMTQSKFDNLPEHQGW